MEQSNLKSESNLSKNKSNNLTTTPKLLALLLLISPLIIFFIFFIYNFILIGLFGKSLLSALTISIIFLLAYQIIISTIRLVQMIVSLKNTRRNVISRRINSRFALVDSPKTQPVSIILWANNQGYNLAETVKSLLSLNYPDYEIIIINDGSTDSTLEVLETEFGLQPLNRIFRRTLKTSSITASYTSPKYPIISVIEKPFTGRADSLNIGLNLAKAPLVCIIEPNHLLTRDALLLLAKPFIEQPSNTIMTAGLGEARVNIEEFSLTENLNVVEKKHLFHSSLVCRDAFCLITGNPNAVRLVKKSELIEVGGFSSNEFSDLTVSLKLQQLLLSKGRDYRLNYIPEILCWEHNLIEPLSASTIHGRWQSDTLLSTINNIKLLFQSPINKEFWTYFLLVLENISPTLSLLGLVLTPISFILGAISLELMLIYFIAFITFSFLESLMGIIADEFSLRYQHTLAEVVNLILASLIESLFYKSATNFWRILGAFRSIFS
ncbi:MAG: glycosyltransferase family 2 protein [Acidobacteria bacterium]|nr:glycosyltransferase family 2 protein [Acidobacteriota bacterium]